IFVANHDSRDLTVIDGLTNNVLATVALPGKPVGVGVNPVSNVAYVIQQLDDSRSSLAIIDGNANTLTGSIPLDGGPVSVSYPYGVAVDPSTNRIYITDDASRLFIVDGANLKLVSTGYTGNRARGGPVVDSSKGRIYVPGGSNTGGVVLVIDAASGKTTG